MKKLLLFALFVALVGLGVGAASVARAQDITLAQLIEMFISLGIIPPEKAVTARAALATLNDQPATSPAASFTRALEIGDRGEDVRLLQKVLNQDPITRIASTGAGSPGSETDYFGAGTRVAVIKFQELHAAEVLAPAGLARGTGYVGGRTIAKLNALIAAPATSGTAQDISGSTPTPSLPAPSCTADTWSCTEWTACSSYGRQDRACNMTFDCPEAMTPSPSILQSCTPPAPSCTADAWSCSDWSACSSSGSQTRTCNMTSDCANANTPSPSTSQSCPPSYEDLHCPKIVKVTDSLGNTVFSPRGRISSSYIKGEVNSITWTIEATDPKGLPLFFEYLTNDFTGNYGNYIDSKPTLENSRTFDVTGGPTGPRHGSIRVDNQDGYGCIGAYYDAQVMFDYTVYPSE